MLFLSDIQHFSVGDGDGIRTTVFFQGCGMRCPWCHNPETLPKHPVTLRFPSNGKTEIKDRAVSAEELLPELMEDLDYYQNSGGGVTFSGGEVLLQADGAAELAALLRENGVSVLIDTAGNVPFSAFEKVDPFVFGYLYDYKSASAEKYRDVIGGDLPLVTENLSRLLAAGKNVRVRIPLIPGFNTDAVSVDELCEKLAALGVGAVDLLPFHRLGSAKYEAMGLVYAYRDTEPLSAGELRAIRERFVKGFTVRVEE